MTLETWSTIASIGTFVVIAATAVAALVQLRHLRSSNQIAALTELQKTLESERFALQRRYVAEQVPSLIADPAGRNKLSAEYFPAEVEAVRDVGNFFEMMGILTKYGILDRVLVCDLLDGVIFRTWKQLEPVVMIRREVASPGTWSSFEYLAVIAEDSIKITGGERYPRGMPRMTIDERSSAAVTALRHDRSHAPK